MSDKIICSVLKSTKKEGMYLYVEKAKGMSQVPDTLKALFGEAQLALTILLTAEKKLAHVNVADVMKAIQTQGFYLQMPIIEKNEMQGMAEKNTKLSHR